MIFNKHSDLQGSHSFLSASKYHWIRYSDEKIADRFLTAMAAARGTELHEFASQAIKLGIRLKGTAQTMNQYVNDCIGFGMIPEQILFFSINAFGTADAIKYTPATKTKPALLRVFDLKTGVTPASFDQLHVYCAYFCLEYGMKPTELEFELRIYQNDDVQIQEGDVDTILHIMDRIITADRIIEELKAEVIR